MRDAVGPHVDLVIEAHERFSTSTAIEVGKRLEAIRPMWYEDPVHHHDMRAMIEVARRVALVGDRNSPIRLSFDEDGLVVEVSVPAAEVEGLAARLADLTKGGATVEFLAVGEGPAPEDQAT